MEEYLEPHLRKQWQDRPVVEVSFFLDGEKKTYSRYEVGLLERATVAALCSTKNADEEATLAHYQVNAFNLGRLDPEGNVTACPSTRGALASFLMGLDTRRSKISKQVIHSPSGPGLYSGQPLLGMYERWDEIFSREGFETPDAINFVTRRINAQTIKRLHNRGPQESVLGNRQSSMVADSGDDGEEIHNSERVIPEARSGFTTAADVTLELPQSAVEAIINDLEAWGEKRIARLLPIYLDGKLTLGNASRWETEEKFKADYAFFMDKVNNKSSKLHRAFQKRQADVIELPVAEVTTKKNRTGRALYHPLRLNPAALWHERTYSLTSVSRYKKGKTNWKKLKCIDPSGEGYYGINGTSDKPEDFEPWDGRVFNPPHEAYSLEVCRRDGRLKAETAQPDKFGKKRPPNAR
jgi:hypothetical protein